MSLRGVPSKGEGTSGEDGLHISLGRGCLLHLIAVNLLLEIIIIPVLCRIVGGKLKYLKSRTSDIGHNWDKSYPFVINGEKKMSISLCHKQH